MSEDKDFVGTTPEAADAWWSFDQQFAPGGLFVNLPPSKRAELEAGHIVRYGERPTAPIDPIEVLHQQTAHKFDVLGASINEEMADFLDSQLDAMDVTEEEIAKFPQAQVQAIMERKAGEVAAKTEAHIRALGMAALPDLVTQGSYGQQVIRQGAEAQIMEAGRHWLDHNLNVAEKVLGIDPADKSDFRRKMAATPQGLRYVVSVDQQRSKRDAALARLPARKAAK